MSMSVYDKEGASVVAFKTYSALYWRYVISQLHAFVAKSPPTCYYLVSSLSYLPITYTVDNI